MSSISRAAIAGLALSGVWIAGCIVEAHPRRVYVAPAPVVVAEPPPPYVVVQPAAPGVIVEVAPPTDIVEVQPVMPGPEFIWIPGYWGWRGGAHIWIGGRWDRGPHHGAVWVPHRWENRGGHWHLQEGHWR